MQNIKSILAIELMFNETACKIDSVSRFDDRIALSVLSRLPLKFTTK